jgi:hypothetical protein
MKTNQIPVILKFSGGYFDRIGQLDSYRHWLTVSGTSFTFILKDLYEDIPLVVILDPRDATAFKLRFGL